MAEWLGAQYDIMGRRGNECDCDDVLNEKRSSSQFRSFGKNQVVGNKQHANKNKVNVAKNKIYFIFFLEVERV